MVPNMTNIAKIAKNHCSPKNLPTFFGAMFYTKIWPLFELPIVSIEGSTLHDGVSKESISKFFSINKIIRFG